MTESLTKEKIESFDRLIKTFGLAMTNSSLYPPNHPVFNSSMRSFKDALDKWLAAEGSLELGISSDNIMLNGAFVKEGSELYRDVAAGLHRKGLIAVSFTEGITILELIDFFTLLEKGDIAKGIGQMPHLTIKEVDYSGLLTSAKTGAAMDEKAMWRSLSGIGRDLGKGELPKSKAEFMASFLKDPKRAAAILNVIYKEAAAKLEGRSTAEEIREVFSEINKYFERYPAGGPDDTKKELVTIMSSLDPGLVVSLFKEGETIDGAPDLADELFKNVSDDGIAEFMASLMQSGKSVNEKMIRLFSRLVSGRERASSILPMVTDKLFDKKLLNEDVLSMLQGSIKELFETHPDDDFITRIYELTVGAFLDKEKTAEPAHGYSALAKEYYESLKEGNLKREKLRLLLNILWLENDAARFKKAADILAGSFHEILAPQNIKIVKEAFELLTEKLKAAGQTRDDAIALTIKTVLDKIGGRETVDTLISFIPGLGREASDDIANILINMKGYPVARVLDLSMKEKDVRLRSWALASLVKSQDAGIIKKLFERPTPDLVRLCGDFKVEGSVPYLKRALRRRGFIMTKAKRALRVQAVLSLGRIGTPEAIGAIEGSANDRDRSVRAMCRMVLESSKTSTEKAG